MVSRVENSWRQLGRFGIVDLMLLVAIGALVISNVQMLLAFRHLQVYGDRQASIYRQPKVQYSQDLQLARVPLPSDGKYIFRVQCRRNLMLVVRATVDGQVTSESLPIGSQTRWLKIGLPSDSSATIDNGVDQRHLSFNAKTNTITFPNTTMNTSQFPFTLATSGEPPGPVIEFLVEQKGFEATKRR